MRIVAGDAWLHRIVCHWVDLGKSGGSGEIEVMADGAKFPFARGHGLHLRGIFDMGFGCAMAGFAGERLVITGLLDFVLLVTFSAWDRTRKANRAGCLAIHGHANPHGGVFD
jgi:hypothetical protein